MRKALHLICIGSLVLTFVAQASTAYSGSDRPDATIVAKKRPAQPRIVTEPRGQIACGRYGCRRIPPNCHPEQTYDPWGNPTGWDAVICR